VIIKPDAFILDMDGTAALHVNPDGSPRRNNFEYAKCSEDLPNERVLRLAELLSRYLQPIVVSGREDTFINGAEVRRDTVNWLAKYSSLLDYPLFMRKADDYRKDDVIKEEIYDLFIDGRFNVLYALDDRPRVLRMWQAKGITTLGVGTPWIEF